MNGARQEHSGTDIAALSAGVVAVSVALFITPGTYDLMNLVISVTLLAVIVGYVLPSARGRMQSIAVATAIGLAAVPGIGFLLEVYLSPPGAWAKVFIGEYEFPREAYKFRDDVALSNVPNWQIVLGWLLISLAMFIVDRNLQKRREAPKQLVPHRTVSHR
jgi:hypothetical protein